MLDDISELRMFVRIVATGSLSAASREMGLALSVVSLIARNTRSLFDCLRQQRDGRQVPRSL